MSFPGPGRWLEQEEWVLLAEAHRGRAEGLAAGYRARRAAGGTHPVEDFLFTYYPVKPARLARWHPGAGTGLAGDDERAGWRWYRSDQRGSWLDVDAFRADRGSAVGFMDGFLRRTGGRAANFGCFGLHEWAMAYRLGQQDQRHRQVPLRLGPAGTDEVVRAHRIRCSHFDAFRFFTPEAVPLNEIRPTRATQVELDQPGCLHVGMDLYKWAAKLGPLVPGDLLLDAFELARDIRAVDMRASPYDLADWGYEPIRIETPEGKAEYVRRQRGFTERGQALRARLLAMTGPLAGSPDA